MRAILRSLRDVTVAQVALLHARARLRNQPIGSMTIRAAERGAPRSGDPDRARELARAVVRAADRGLFRPFCLVRALALQDLLQRHNITGSEIRVGVRHRSGSFAAHAWVRWGDEILGDDPAHVASFTEVDDIRVLGGS